MSPEKAYKLSVCLCPHPPLEVSTFVTVYDYNGYFMEYLVEILTDLLCVAFSHS